MEQLLNYELTVNATRKFTNQELRMMRKILDDAIFSRMIRRQYVMDDSISRVMTNILSKAIADAGYSEILGQDLWFYYYPAFRTENYKNPDKDGSLVCCAKIGIYFNYGETLTAKKHDYDEETKEFNNRYILEIKLKDSLQIKIYPPAHHVRTPPYEKGVWSHTISNQAKIKWILEQKNVPRKQNCGISNCIIKSPLATNIRKLIYGEKLLKSLVDFYIIKKNARLLMNQCHRIMTKYNRHFITAAHSATMCFLIIGRFYPKAISGLSIENQANWNHIIPYDVIQLIAKYVWDSRYENEIWGTDTREVLAIPPIDNETPEKKLPTYDEDYYAAYYKYGPHGWTPWFKSSVFNRYSSEDNSDRDNSAM